jgi:DNA-3-methyladenine glycosylase
MMWGQHGRAYVYLIYGMHYCFNAVCRPPGVAEAVLVRAVEPVGGEDLMRSRRPVVPRRELTSGPAKLCDAMDIDRSHDGLDLCSPASPLFIARNPAVDHFRATHGPIVTTTRIGITRAADLPLRFYLEGSLFVSRRSAQGAPKPSLRSGKAQRAA